MIIVNGESKPYVKGVTIAQYLEQEGYRTDRIAVEVNEEIVPKAHYETREMNDKDKIEIIHFVGGG